MGGVSQMGSADLAEFEPKAANFGYTSGLEKLPVLVASDLVTCSLAFRAWLTHWFAPLKEHWLFMVSPVAPIDSLEAASCTNRLADKNGDVLPPAPGIRFPATKCESVICPSSPSAYLPCLAVYLPLTSEESQRLHVLEDQLYEESVTDLRLFTAAEDVEFDMLKTRYLLAHPEGISQLVTLAREDVYFRMQCKVLSEKARATWNYCAHTR
ncbi:hypothetical protein HKX48_001826 [Thoreauomyces humboldtii]|nr:hypothetical protein HKX48_001826 [Thoreauomyces humboldtii]